MTRRYLLFLCRTYDPGLRYWSLPKLRIQVRGDHPDWSSAEVEEQARNCHRQLFDEILAWYNCQRRFHRHNRLSGTPEATAWGLPEDDEENNAG